MADIFATLLGFSPALAETGPAAPADTPVCLTNLGADGQIMAGVAGLAYAPVTYDEVRVVGDCFTANR